MIQQRLRAVMAGSHVDPVRVQDRADIVGVYAVYDKIQNAVMFCRIIGSDQMQMGDLLHPLHGVRCQRVFPFRDRIKSKSGDVVDGRMKSYRISSIDSSRLKFVRQFCPNGTFSGDRLDHFTTGQERRHGLQEFPLSIQNTNAHWAQQLMPGEDEEVRVHTLHIHCHMRRALCTVHYCDRADAVRLLNDLFNRVSAPCHIGDFIKSHQAGPLCDRLINRLVRDASVLLTFQIAQFRTCAASNHLPRQNIAVMLSDRHHDLIPFAEIGQAVAVGDQIQALRCVAGKDDLRALFRVDELSHRFSRVLVAVRRVDTQLIEPAQGVCIRVFVEVLHCFDHAVWFLGCSRIIQIGLIRLNKKRKITADAIGYFRVHSYSSSIPRNAFASCSAVSSPISRMILPILAPAIRSTAFSSDIPRELR